MSIFNFNNKQNKEFKDVILDIYEPLYEKLPLLKVPGYWTTLEENLEQWTKQVKVTSSWGDFSKKIQQQSYLYSTENKCPLLEKGLRIDDIYFVRKSIASIQEKLKRKFLSEDGYLNEMAFVKNDGDFPIPNLGDLVRIRLVVSYLDGIKFISNLLESSVSGVTVEFKGNKEGYFACHINFKEDVFLKYDNRNIKTQIQIEVQIATHSATRVWELSHHLYEEERPHKEADYSWQWEHQHPKFLCHQLGHTLHLTEGLFVQLRDQLNKNI